MVDTNLDSNDQSLSGRVGRKSEDGNIHGGFVASNVKCRLTTRWIEARVSEPNNRTQLSHFSYSAGLDLGGGIVPREMPGVWG